MNNTWLSSVDISLSDILLLCSLFQARKLAATYNYDVVVMYRGARRSRKRHHQAYGTKGAGEALAHYFKGEDCRGKTINKFFKKADRMKSKYIHEPVTMLSLNVLFLFTFKNQLIIFGNNSDTQKLLFVCLISKLQTKSKSSQSN